MRRVRTEEEVCARYGKDKILWGGGINKKKRVVVWAESSSLVTTFGSGFGSLYLLSFGTCACLFHICSRFWLFIGHLSHSEASQRSAPGLLTVLYRYIHQSPWQQATSFSFDCSAGLSTSQLWLRRLRHHKALLTIPLCMGKVGEAKMWLRYYKVPFFTPLWARDIRQIGKRWFG